MAIFHGKGRRRGEIFGRIVKYIMDHLRSTLKDVAQYLKEEYKLEVSVKTIERELEEYDLSDLYKLVREKEKLIMPEGGFSSLYCRYGEEDGAGICSGQC